MDCTRFLTDFSVNFLADLLAGLLALLLGIPVGLWIDRMIQRRNKRDLQDTIYYALRDETLFNIRRMTESIIVCRPDGRGDGLPMGYASSSAWMSIVDGGQIGLLEDNELLQVCFSLYRLVDRMNTDMRRLERMVIGVSKSDEEIGSTRAVLRMLIGNAARDGIELSIALLRLLGEDQEETESRTDSLNELLSEWDNEKARIT